MKLLGETYPEMGQKSSPKPYSVFRAFCDAKIGNVKIARLFKANFHSAVRITQREEMAVDIHDKRVSIFTTKGRVFGHGLFV